MLKDKFIGKSWNIEIDNWFWDKFLYFKNIFYIFLNKKKSNQCWIKININDKNEKNYNLIDSTTNEGQD